MSNGLSLYESPKTRKQRELVLLRNQREVERRAQKESRKSERAERDEPKPFDIYPLICK